MALSLNSQHAHYITVLGRRLPLIAKKHPRARSFVVRYDAKNQCVKVTCPRYAPLKAALAFAASKEAWLALQIEKTPAIRLIDGAEISLFGDQVVLQHIGGRGLVAREGNALKVTGDIDFFARRVRDYIRKEMIHHAHAMAARHAEKIGVDIASITLRDTTSRWGSCSNKGALSLCVRLAFAPLAVLDYVIAHEVAHIKHLNHSERFWQVVAHLCPEFEQHERWLARHGQQLQAAFT